MIAQQTNNRFLGLLAASQQKNSMALNPIQKLHSLKNEMRALAEAGDLKSWREKLPRVDQLVKTIQFDAFRKLEWETGIKQLELTLLLKAVIQTHEQAKATQNEAGLAERSGDKKKAEDLSAKTKKLVSFGRHLQEQLLAKTKLNS